MESHNSPPKKTPEGKLTKLIGMCIPLEPLKRYNHSLLSNSLKLYMVVQHKEAHNCKVVQDFYFYLFDASNQIQSIQMPQELS